MVRHVEAISLHLRFDGLSHNERSVVASICSKIWELFLGEAVQNPPAQ